MTTTSTELRETKLLVRFSLNHSVGDGGESRNAFQEKVAKVITDYTKGSINVNAFKSELQAQNVPIDANMDKLIRKHESGDFQTYNEFGKHIFRQLNGYVYSFINNLYFSTDTYNRVDKIHMNNTKIVAPEKTGKNHFAFADEIKQPKSRAIDDHHIEQEGRHLGSVYVPKKGQTSISGIN